MIAIDMDGTLVHPDGTVSAANQAALEAARAQGAQIVIATGRRHAYAMKVLSTANFRGDDVVLSSNGAVARTIAGDLLFRTELPQATALWLCGELNGFRNALVFTFDRLDSAGNEGAGVLVMEELDELNGSIEKWMVANARDIRRVVPIEDALQDASELPIQAMLCGAMNRMDRAEALLTATHGGRLTLTRTEYPGRDLCILDILPNGVSKGTGLRRLLEKKGLSAAHLMAIGDNWNDVTMLEIARWPALMGNAPLQLQEKARQSGWPVMVEHHEDGVAQAIATCFNATL